MLGASQSFSNTHRKPTQAPLGLYALGLANARQKGTRVPHRLRLFLTARSQGLYALGVNSANSSALYENELSNATTSLHFATSMRTGLWWKRARTPNWENHTHRSAQRAKFVARKNESFVLHDTKKKAAKNDDNPALLQECDEDARLRKETRTPC